MSLIALVIFAYICGTTAVTLTVMFVTDRSKRKVRVALSDFFIAPIAPILLLIHVIIKGGSSAAIAETERKRLKPPTPPICLGCLDDDDDETEDE